MLLTQNQNVEDKQVYCSTKKGYRNKGIKSFSYRKAFLLFKIYR